MRRDRWQRLQDLFVAAVDLAPAERDAYLSEACDGDPDLRREVEALIDAESAASGLVDGALPGPSERQTRTAAAEQLIGPGGRIGHYRILQELGGGGMGVVYLAEQEQPVRRRVALKQIKWGMDTHQVVARFESERQALALMKHPNIAGVFDGGATPQGRPYFVMEYVNGLPITAYCDAHRLTTRERLELFIQVCNGIQHAHQKGVIHRDIKPSNVLVELGEGKGLAKIIDFGVAKAVSQRLTEDTVYTEVGQYVGTPEYMSPEQAGSSPLDVDTRTDVYGLGVLLYELLCGAKPLALTKRRETPLDEILRRVREDEPSRPSSRLSMLDTQSSTEIAGHRRVDVASLRRLLRDDLDWITMKALEKDRSRRYESPADLAEDIGRYLRSEPVAAGPPSATYRAKKFVARHRVGVVAGVAVLLSVVVGIAGMSVGLVRALRAEGLARDEAVRANLEADTAHEVTAFLVGLFEVSDPGRAQGRDITARALLDEGSKRIDRELSGQPLVRARIQNTIGEVYQRLGLLDEARVLVDEAYRTRELMLGDEHPDTLRSLIVRANLEERDANYDEAMRLHADALERSRKAMGREDPLTLDALAGLGRTYHEWGRYEDAEPLMKEALNLARRIFGEGHERTTGFVTGLADVYTGQQRWEEALALYRQAAETLTRHSGANHPATISASANVGNALLVLGRADEAEPLLIDALERRRRVLGDDHESTLWSFATVAQLYIGQGRGIEATPLLRRAFAGYVQGLGSDHARSLIAASNLAENLISLGFHQEAESLLHDTLERCRRALGEDNRWTHRANHLLGVTYDEQGRYEEAERYYRTALEARIRIVGEAAWETGNTRRRLIALYDKTGRKDEADALRAAAAAMAR